jgi:hypothetical protein
MKGSVHSEKKAGPANRHRPFCIPGGALISWLALTGIQLGDSIYRFPYFIILGGVLVIGGIVNIIGGAIALAHS